MNEGTNFLSPKHSQSSELEVSPETCNVQEKPSCFFDTNCDLSITVKKAVRSCTKYPIAHSLLSENRLRVQNYKYYEFLSYLLVTTLSVRHSK